MNRRQFSKLSAFAAAAAITRDAQAVPPRTTMGICTTSYMTAGRPRDMLVFLDHCVSMGAGGIQCAITSHEPEYLKNVRQKAEAAGMFIETMGPLPKAQTQEAFAKNMESSKALGSLCLRTACLSGRRYETFNDLATWKKFVSDSHEAVARASKMAERAKFPVVVENHKDWTADELVELMKKYGNDYFGVCLDTGNNISLLDDPFEPIEKLAPYALSTHIKDMGVAEYKNGFLLSEVPFGEGIVDLKKAIRTIRAARPRTRFTLEMITRNPLEVPVLTDKYWLTLDDARTPSRLASMLRMVRENPPKLPLQTIRGLSSEAVKELEIQNVKACLHYAHHQLDNAS